MNKLIKKVALWIPAVKKHYEHVTNMRCENEAMRNQIENLSSQSEQIKANYEIQFGQINNTLRQLNSMFEDNVKISWSANNQRKQWICTNPFSRLEINPGGHVSTCCLNYLKYDYTMGNAFENSLNEVWNCDWIKKLRYSVSNGNFEYCKEEFCNMLREPSKYSSAMIPRGGAITTNIKNGRTVYWRKVLLIFI